MDEISWGKFQEELNQIRQYIQHIQYVQNVLDSAIVEENTTIKTSLQNLKKHDKNFKNQRRIFEYKAVIISLYGLLEKYVKTWIEEYLKKITILISDYNQIDDKIKDNHFKLSLKLIDNIIRGIEEDITKEEVLINLNSCIANHFPYVINTKAFVLSSGNLKHNKIVELFQFLNIDLNNELIKNEKLNQEIGVSNIERREKDILYYKINDLVERRNVIDHDSSVDNTLDISELEVYIQFLEVYCQAIFETISEKIIQQESIHTFQKIEKIIDIYNNKILAFTLENYTIKVGDIIIIETAEGKFYKKPILEIQLNKKSHQELTIYEKNNIAVRVDSKIKDNQKFYIAKKGIII